MYLDIKINPDLLQIHLRFAHRYPNPIQIHFKPTQIQSDWIWITWILSQIHSIAIPNFPSFPDSFFIYFKSFTASLLFREVNIAQEWIERLPLRSYDEEYVLKRNSRTCLLNLHSRLGCQVVLAHDLERMVVAIPEPKLWDSS